MSAIPENHIKLCRSFCLLAKDNGLRRLTAVIRPAFDDPWNEDINLTWESGRHGEDSGNVYIESTTRVRSVLVKADKGGEHEP